MYDLHTHTVFSDGRNKIVDMVRAAEAVGLEGIAITDHYFNGDDTAWLGTMLEEINEHRDGTSIQLLSGLEGVILDLDGSLSITPGVAMKVDLVLVDMGGRTRGLGYEVPPESSIFKEMIIQCLERVCLNPLVDIIAHPINLGRFAHQLPPDAFTERDLDRLAQAFMDGGTYFEIMNQMYYWYPQEDVTTFLERYSKLVAGMASRGVRFTLGSDAHSVCGVGNLRWCYRVIKMANISKTQIATLDELKTHSRRKREQASASMSGPLKADM